MSSDIKDEECLEKKKIMKEAQQRRAEEKKKKTELIKENMKKNAVKKKTQSKIVYINETPKGEKKKVTEKEMLSNYDVSSVEATWYDWWERKGFFKPESSDGIVHYNPKGVFVMVIPPPNVTGTLHIGHALTIAIEDSLTRWHRMLGKTVLWNPGCDHAGIATQVVVEKKLWKERKQTRHDLGREEFLNEVWKWKKESGNTIYQQLKDLGASVDWDRACFTMDPKMQTAVTEAFVKLYEMNYIRRSVRIVNWSSSLKSAISDLEVDHIELEGRTMLSIPSHGNASYEFGVMIQFAYKIEDSDDEIVVSTTRIETMLGDVCVAVNPNDSRWKHLHGKWVVHPFLNRKMPIICDDCVDISLGTGALKVTPGHDKKDFDLGLRHSLPLINILNDDGTINNISKEFQGMKRYDARIAIIGRLKELGLFRDSVSHPMSIPLCSRSKDIIEELVRPQWFMDCSELSQQALRVVQERSLEIIPETHTLTWQKWLENTKDWCISRQLWWGHRIPAYKVLVDGKEIEEKEENRWIVAKNEQEALKIAVHRYEIDEKRIQLFQDPDVLDTWFSSGLFPFSIFGWPEQTEDYKRFFPGNLLETGHDILFFWVARMVMLSLALTKQLPFKTVYLHAIIKDAYGRKMSKSLGNVIDPIDIIKGVTLETLLDKLENSNLNPKEVQKAREAKINDFPNGIAECGTDSLRFTLIANTIAGKDVNLDVNRMITNRHFCNKIWNANKMFHLYCSDYQPERDVVYPTDEYSIMDKWILSRKCFTITESFRKYNFSSITDSIYEFWKDELCDVYLETIKQILKSSDRNSKRCCYETLYTCLEVGLRLLHPIMPFLTEELWQRLPKRTVEEVESICVSSYPEKIFYQNLEIEQSQTISFEIVRSIRGLRSSYLKPSDRPSVTIVVKVSSLKIMFCQFHSMICSLCELSQLFIVSDTDQIDRSGCAIDIVSDKAEVLLLVKGLIDSTKEIQKLSKKKESVTTLLGKLKKRLESPESQKVPSRVLEMEHQKLTSYENELLQLENSLLFYCKI